MAITEKPRKTSKINTWKPKDSSQLLVEQDGKLFVCHFDNIFGYDKASREKLSLYNIFMIGKESYINQLGTIAPYTNFFINNYDADMELVTAYLKIKYALDHDKLFDLDSMNAYIDFIYNVMFTDTMNEKICALVEENYLDDIETSTEEKKKYLKNEKKHLESLEFTNQHIKILLRISFGMKIMSPALFHFIQRRHIKIEKDSDIIFRFYKRLFDIFGYGVTYDLFNSNDELLDEGITEEDFEMLSHDIDFRKDGVNSDTKYWFTNENGEECYYVLTKINMYNKLYVYVKAKILESNANNSPIFSQREIFGVDVYSVINQFTKKVLISENVVKYKFNEHWDTKLKKYKENIVGFNKTIIKFQISYFLKEQYTKNLNEVTNAKNSEGLSGADKMLMNQTKLDEGSVILTDLNIKFTLEKIMRDIDVPISEEEIDYYVKNHHPSPIQIQMVNGYYTKYFGSYRDLNLVNRKYYITLMLILKKKLLLELGYEKDENGEIHYASLPYILSGNLSDKVNTRVIRNNKFIAKIEDSYMYQDLINSKYRLLNCLKPESVLSLLSSVINTRFTYVTYEYPEMFGTEITYSEDKISDELLFFLDSL